MKGNKSLNDATDMFILHRFAEISCLVHNCKWTIFHCSFSLFKLMFWFLMFSLFHNKHYTLIYLSLFNSFFWFFLFLYLEKKKSEKLILFFYFWFFKKLDRQFKHLVGVKKSLPGLKNSPQNCGKSDTYKVFSTCSMSWFHDKNYLILLIFNIFCIVCSDSNIFNFWNGLLLLWNSKNLI